MLNVDSQRAHRKRQTPELYDVLAEMRSLRDANLLLATRVEELQKELLLSYSPSSGMMSIESDPWWSTWRPPPVASTQTSNPELSQLVPFQAFSQNGGLWDSQLL